MQPYPSEQGRTVAIEITPADWPNFPDPNDPENPRRARRTIKLQNSKPWEVHAVDLFFGIDRSQWDEFTLVAYVRQPNGNWFNLAEHISEKDDPTSGWQAHKTKMIWPVLAPPNAEFMLVAHHSNDANPPHAKIRFRARFVP